MKFLLSITQLLEKYLLILPRDARSTDCFHETAHKARDIGRQKHKWNDHQFFSMKITSSLLKKLIVAKKLRIIFHRSQRIKEKLHILQWKICIFQSCNICRKTNLFFFSIEIPRLAFRFYWQTSIAHCTFHFRKRSLYCEGSMEAVPVRGHWQKLESSVKLTSSGPGY